MKVTEFSQLRSTLQQAARKQAGSLAVRDLSPLVDPSRLVDTENLTTLLVVVPKPSRGEWVAQYEGLSEFVVPRSSAVVAEDQDYCVFTVVLFKRVVDNFKTAARSKGFQVGAAGAAAADAGAGAGVARRAGGGAVGWQLLVAQRCAFSAAPLCRLAPLSHPCPARALLPCLCR
jgi:hypothetical protein